MTPLETRANSLMAVPATAVKWHLLPLHGTFLHCSRKSPGGRGGHTNYFNEIKQLAAGKVWPKEHFFFQNQHLAQYLKVTPIRPRRKPPDRGAAGAKVMAAAGERLAQRARCAAAVEVSGPGPQRAATPAPGRPCPAAPCPCVPHAAFLCCSKKAFALVFTDFLARIIIATKICLRCRRLGRAMQKGRARRPCQRVAKAGARVRRAGSLPRTNSARPCRS